MSVLPVESVEAQVGASETHSLFWTEVDGRFKEGSGCGASTTNVNSTGSSSQPSMIWLTRRKILEPTRGTPNLAVWRAVMSAEPWTAGGQRPIMRKPVQVLRPALSGAEARRRVWSPGSSGQARLILRTPATLVTERLETASLRNRGYRGGRSNSGLPKYACG